MVREEKERPAFSAMEKLEMKRKYYPNEISLPWVREVYDDGVYNKYASGRIMKRHISKLSDDEVDMWKAAPKSAYTGTQMEDKAGNVYWVFIENHVLYKGSGAAASEDIGVGYGSTRRM